MFFQQHMRLPVGVEVTPPSAPELDCSQDNIDEIVASLLKSRESAFQSAKENIDNAQKAQKETYDRKHLQSELSVGTKVWLENTAQKERKGGKMEPVWLGPYEINRSLGKGVYELKNDKGEIIKKKANIKRLKLYIHRKRKISDDDQPEASKRY